MRGTKILQNHIAKNNNISFAFSGSNPSVAMRRHRRRARAKVVGGDGGVDAMMCVDGATAHVTRVSVPVFGPIWICVWWQKQIIAASCVGVSCAHFARSFGVVGWLRHRAG